MNIFLFHSAFCLPRKYLSENFCVSTTNFLLFFFCQKRHSNLSGELLFLHFSGRHRFWNPLSFCFNVNQFFPRSVSPLLSWHVPLSSRRVCSNLSFLVGPYLLNPKYSFILAYMCILFGHLFQ